MAQKITLLLRDENVDFAKREAKRRGTSMFKMLDECLDLLKRVEGKIKSEKLHPGIPAFSPDKVHRENLSLIN